MDRNELVVTQCGGYALEQVEGAAAGLDPEAARAAERLRTGRWAYRAVKRAFDVCFSACVLVCLSWLFLIVAVAIKLDDPDGPVIFSQARVGRDGREFRMYKFRSMCADAESRLAELAGRNEKDGPVFKMADDPRVTRVGRFLRKTSIDELPQFVNVLVCVEHLPAHARHGLRGRDLDVLVEERDVRPVEDGELRLRVDCGQLFAGRLGELAVEASLAQGPDDG